MVERRKYARIPDSSQIAYQRLASQKIDSFVLKDISQGGVRFFAHEFIPENSHVKIKCVMGKISFSFEAVVKVVWITQDPYSEKYEIGAEFIDIPKKSVERLGEYIDYVRSAS